jgi:hypothetical protein
MLNMYCYFNHSPKRYLGFQRLAQTLETKGNKIIKNVKTKWMSMLDPLKRIIVKYNLLLAMMQADYYIIHVTKVFLSPSTTIMHLCNILGFSIFMLLF